MKTLATAAAAILPAGAALAHEGSHFHPHGFEPVLFILAVAVLGVLAYYRRG